MQIYELDNVNDFEVTLPILNEDLENKLTVRQVYAFWVNQYRYEEAKKMYATQFKFLRREPIGPIVNNVPSILHTLHKVNLFAKDGLKHGVIRNVYPGYGLEPFKQNLSVISALCKGRTKRTQNRNTITAVFPASEQKEPGIYNLLLLAEVCDFEGKQHEVWLIEIDNQELLNLIEKDPNYSVVYSEKDDNSQYVTTDNGIVTTDRL